MWLRVLITSRQLVTRILLFFVGYKGEFDESYFHAGTITMPLSCKFRNVCLTDLIHLKL